MLLQSIINYCKENRWVDSVSMAQYFKRDVAAIEGIMDTLEHRCMLRKMLGSCSPGKCGNCTSGCGPIKKTTRYMWLD